MYSDWVVHYFCSIDRVTRHFALLQCSIVCIAAACCLINPVGFLGLAGAPLVSAWGIFMLILAPLNVREERLETKLAEYTRLTLFVVCMLAVLVFYDGCNRTTRSRYAMYGEELLNDDVLLRADDVMLGWLFPKGQIALWLDGLPHIGTETLIGKICAEVLQLFYTSYYFWGNGLGVYLAVRYFYATFTNSHASTHKKKMQWRRLVMFMNAWVGTFLFNFILNMLVPAVSPRIWIKDMYKTEIQCIWLANYLRSAIGNAAQNTFGAFPSGHCALSFLAAYVGVRMGFKRFGNAAAVAAVLIALATQVLRYHYFVDFLVALPLAAAGLWFGGFTQQDLYVQSLTGAADGGKACSTPLGSVTGSDARLASKVDSLDEEPSDEPELTSLSRSRSLEFEMAQVV